MKQKVSLLLALFLPLTITICSGQEVANQQRAATDRCHGILVRLSDPGISLPAITAAEWEEELTAWANKHGLEAIVWRGLALAEPTVGKGIWERVAERIEQPYRELLFRGWDDGESTQNEGYTVVIDAVKALYRRQGEKEIGDLLARAVCWMAGPELFFIIEAVAGAEQESLWCRSLPRKEFELILLQSERERDKCLEHLVVQPLPREGAPAVRPTSFHGEGHDQAAEWLQQKKGAIPVAEFRRRVIEAARSEKDALFSSAPCWRKALSLEVTARASKVLERIAGETEGVLKLEGVDDDPVVAVRVSEACAGDLVAGVARLAGWVVLPEKNGSLTITSPRGLREKFSLALPLSLWAGVTITPVERDIARSDATRRFWQRLGAENRKTLTTEGTAMSNLPEQARSALKEMICLDAARRLAPWLLNLPDRNSRVLLCLYESEEMCFFELAAPTVSEVVQGFQYLCLKSELEGHPALVRKVIPPAGIKEGGGL